METKHNSATPNYNYLYSLDLSTKQCPIVYRDNYNISFFGVEKLHPFDSKKWGRVFRFIKEMGLVTDEKIVQPKEARKEDLLLVHSDSYLRSLKWRINLVQILEVPIVILFPPCLVDRRVLKAMRFQTGGSVLAGRLALQYGWAINIGGGFHHASRERGGGFCVYADVSLLIHILLQDQLINRTMIVDLDAHQGNGYQRDFATMRDKVYIMDFFNQYIYPQDNEAKMSISRLVPLRSGIDDEIYLPILRRELDAAFDDFSSVDLLVYIAGTDSLEGDPLGGLQLSPKGIMQRDELVFRAATRRSIPIVMLTSGGYTQKSARVIADSIMNLHKCELIKW